MLALSLFTAALVAPALVAAQTVPYKSPFYFANPIQLDGKKCITPSGNGTAVAGATLVINDCNSSAGQKITWSGTSVRSGSFCWTAHSGSNVISLATCNSSDPNQGWFYGKFGGRFIRHTPTQQCVNLASAITTNGNPVQLLACAKVGKQIWNPYYPEGEQLAQVALNGQTGTNQCGTNSSSTALCKNVWINDINDFCIWGPPVRGTVGDQEAVMVSYCLRSGRGTRTIPDGTFRGVHFVKTATYIQITGVGDFTKVNVAAGDSGGEADNHGATADGNPRGGLVYGNVHAPHTQYHEWSNFISDREFCFRACLSETAAIDCPHIYDVMGCFWNQPANYNSGVFESCNGDKTLPAGIYGGSTFHQGDPTTPPPHATASSSQCAFQSTVKVQPLGSTTTNPPPPPPSAVPIKSAGQPTKCIAAVSGVNGADVVIQDCNGSPNQQFLRVGNEFHVLGLCLDIRGGANVNGTRVQVWSCGGTNANQQFSLNASGDQHITWIGKNQSFDVTKGNFTSGNPIQIWQRSVGNANQMFTFSST